MDKNLLGAISYVNGRGFPGYFFPYREQDDYLEPIIAVQFLGPTRENELKSWSNIFFA